MIASQSTVGLPLTVLPAGAESTGTLDIPRSQQRCFYAIYFGCYLDEKGLKGMSHWEEAQRNTQDSLEGLSPWWSWTRSPEGGKSGYPSLDRYQEVPDHTWTYQVAEPGTEYAGKLTDRWFRPEQ